MDNRSFMKGSIFIILSFLFIQVIYSQQGKAILKGNVSDALTKENLKDATVQLLSLPDSLVVYKTLTRKDGFLLKEIYAGDYVLKVSYAEYQDSCRKIRIIEPVSEYNTGNILLNHRSRQLMKVIVKALIPPVIVRNDTIQFNAEAFRTVPNVTVGELMKILPGMEVDREGNLRFQGQTIQKIYIDGKEFFLNDPKLVTQNFLADMVSKVQVFDEKTERAKLSGVSDINPGKALNLQLKPGKNKGLFGNARTAFASQQRYAIRARVNYFKNDTYTIVEFSNNNGGDLQSGGGAVLNSRTNNFALNYNNNRNKKLQYGMRYSFNANSSKNNMGIKKEIFFTDSSLLQERSVENSNRTESHQFNGSLNAAIDSFSSFSAGITFDLRQNENSSSELADSRIEFPVGTHPVNNAAAFNKTNTQTLNGSFSMNYNHQFQKKGRFISINFSTSKNYEYVKTSLQTITRLYDALALPSDSLQRDQRSGTNGDGRGINLNISYAEPLGPHQVLDLGWQWNSTSNNSGQQTNNYNATTNNYDLKDSLATNAFNNNNATGQLSLGYNYFKNKLRYQAGIAATMGKQQNHNSIYGGENIKQRDVNIFPRASVLYTIAKQKTLQLNYNGSSRQPLVNELQSVPDYSNPLLIKTGNPNLRQQFSNNINLGYNAFDVKKLKVITAQLQFNNIIGKIVNTTRTSAQGIQEERYINLDGNYALNASISYSFPIGIKRRNGNIQFNTALGYGNDISVVNGELNKRRSLNVGQSLKLDYNKGDKLFATINASLYWNRFNYTLQNNAATILFAQNYSCNLSYQFPRAISVSTDLALSFSNGQRSFSAQNAAVWNGAVIKRVINNKGELKLSVYDILNCNNNFSQTMGDNYIETIEKDVVKRMFILSFVYRFRVNRI